MNKIFLHFLINQTTQIYNIFVSQFFFSVLLSWTFSPTKQSNSTISQPGRKSRFSRRKTPYKQLKNLKKNKQTHFFHNFSFLRLSHQPNNISRFSRRKTPHEIKPRIDPSMEQASLSSNPSFFRSHVINPRKISAFGAGTINPTDFSFKPHGKSEMTM